MLAGLSRKAMVFDGEINSILNIFTILKKVFDFGELHLKKGQNDKQNVNKDDFQMASNAQEFREKFKIVGKAAYRHMDDFCDIFERLLLQIEVNTSAGKQYIYFPFNPVFGFLAKSTKNRIMGEVNR